MVKVAEGLFLLAGKDLQLWHEKMKRRTADGTGDPLLTARELETLATAGIKLTRLLDDKPTDITKHEVTDISEAKAKLFAALAGRRAADDNDTPTKSEEGDDT